MNELLMTLFILIGLPMGLVLAFSIMALSTYIAILPIQYCVKKYYKPKPQEPVKFTMERHDVIICILMFCLCPLVAILYYVCLLSQYKENLQKPNPESVS